MPSEASPWRRGAPRERFVYWTIWWLLALVMAAMTWVAETGGDLQHQQMNVDLGLWATWLLVASLAISPAATLLRRTELLRYRRAVALFAFAYTLVHGLDYMFYAHAWQGNLRFWQRRLYIAIGIAALLVMLPLVATSADALRRKMGPLAWRGLHRWVYVVAVLVVVHLLWEGPIDYTQQWLCSAALGVLLIARLPPVKRALQSRPARVRGNTSRLVS
jgi:sulfoxide reductase heme-binding subunit YedZ